MIIIKDVPGLTTRETLEALMDISDEPVATGHGGLVVDEETAAQFLEAYLIAVGKREAPSQAGNTNQDPAQAPAKRQGRGRRTGI